MHGTETPSPWVQRWSHLVPAGGSVLDVACGAGRHLRWFAGRGHAVIGVDRDPAACRPDQSTDDVDQGGISLPDQGEGLKKGLRKVLH